MLSFVTVMMIAQFLISSTTTSSPSSALTARARLLNLSAWEQRTALTVSCKQQSKTTIQVSKTRTRTQLPRLVCPRRSKQSSRTKKRTPRTPQSGTGSTRCEWTMLAKPIWSARDRISTTPSRSRRLRRVCGWQKPAERQLSKLLS